MISGKSLAVLPYEFRKCRQLANAASATAQKGPRGNPFGSFFQQTHSWPSVTDWESLALRLRIIDRRKEGQADNGLTLINLGWACL